MPLTDALLSALLDVMLFRGMIAGSLGRRLPVAWANLAQAPVFPIAPHFCHSPDAGAPRPHYLVFIVALVTEWIRTRSGSIIGPWLIHARYRKRHHVSECRDPARPLKPGPIDDSLPAGDGHSCSRAP